MRRIFKQNNVASFLVLAASLYFLNFPLFSLSRSIASEVCATYPEPEAKKWIQDPRRELQFALKRFPGPGEAERFIDRLYRFGAIYIGVVFVMGDASALKIYLPLDFDRREEIFKIANTELTKAGYRTETDSGQNDLTIWFQ